MLRKRCMVFDIGQGTGICRAHEVRMRGEKFDFLIQKEQRRGLDFLVCQFRVVGQNDRFGAFGRIGQFGHALFHACDKVGIADEVRALDSDSL